MKFANSKQANWLYILVFSFGMFALNSCNSSKAKIDTSLQTYFDKYNVTGSFAFMNNATGKLKIYNLQTDTARQIPGGSFYIMETLIGLQTGALVNDTASLILKADTATQLKKYDLPNAFQTNNYTFFDATIHKIGTSEITRWVDTVNYGNTYIGNNLDSFWMNNTLLISPDEQLGFVKRLYFEQLPFRKSVQQSVANLMAQQQTKTYKLYYKVSTDSYQNKAYGWLLGWVEVENHVYFFSQYITPKNANTVLNDSVSVALAKDILQYYGYLPNGVAQ